MVKGQRRYCVGGQAKVNSAAASIRLEIWDISFRKPVRKFSQSISEQKKIYKVSNRILLNLTSEIYKTPFEYLFYQSVNFSK